MPTTTAPARPFRIVRGEGGNYRTHRYTTRQRRDAAAERFAAQDGSSVLTELWRPDHPQDDLNRGWACDGHAPAPGDQEPEVPTGERGPASRIVPGDTVTVWAARDLDARHGWRTGTVTDVTAGVSWHGIPARLIETQEDDLARRECLTVVDTAVTVWHD